MIVFMTTEGHVNYKLAFTNSFANDKLQRHLPSASMEIQPHAAIAVDLQQPLREFRVDWGTLFQGIWWDRSLDSWIFLGTDFMILILASPCIYKSTKSLHGDIRSSWLAKTICKMSTGWYWTPPSPKPYNIDFTLLPLWSSLSELPEMQPPGL